LSTADLRWIRKFYPRLASVAAHRITGYAELHDMGTELRYFTFMRDPVRVCASRWQAHVDVKRGKRTFDEWLSMTRSRNPQILQIAGCTDVAEAIRVIDEKNIFVGLTERFDESLVLLKALRAPDLDTAYRPVNVARRTTVARELLADEQRRRQIEDANRADIELYQYVRDEVFPRFRAAYGEGLADAVSAQERLRTRGFDERRLLISRIKQYGLYKPATRIRIRLGVLDR
jgi:hypothetical protein